jgi:hypothetical protein
MRERGSMIQGLQIGLAGTAIVAMWLAAWALLAYVFVG